MLFEGFSVLDVAIPRGLIHTRVGGSGPPLLLLHGCPETHLMWHAVAPAIYDHDQYLLFVRDDGSVARVDRAQNMAMFEGHHRAGDPPLSTEAEVLHIEQQS